MSKPFNLTSQNALACELIIYDEIINPSFVKKNLFGDFIKLCDTLKRKKTAKIFLLGNKHKTDNDLLDGFGVEFQ
jgi:hypothetical protein